MKMQPKYLYQAGDTKKKTTIFWSCFESLKKRKLANSRHEYEKALESYKYPANTRRSSKPEYTCIIYNTY